MSNPSFYTDKLSLNCKDCIKFDRCEIIKRKVKLMKEIKQIKKIGSIQIPLSFNKGDELPINKKLREIEDKQRKCLNRQSYLAVVYGYHYFTNQHEWNISDCNKCMFNMKGQCYYNIHRKNKRGFCKYYKEDITKEKEGYYNERGYYIEV